MDIEEVIRIHEILIDKYGGIKGKGTVEFRELRWAFLFERLMPVSCKVAISI